MDVSPAPEVGTPEAIQGRGSTAGTSTDIIYPVFNFANHLENGFAHQAPELKRLTCPAAQIASAAQLLPAWAEWVDVGA